MDRIGELVQIIGADALSVEVWAGALRPDLLDGKAEVAGAASERRPADARRGVSPVVACRPVWRSSPVALPTHLAFASPSSPPADLAEQLRISPQAQLGLINQLVALEGCAEPPDGQPGGLGRGVTGASCVWRRSSSPQAKVETGRNPWRLDRVQVDQAGWRRFAGRVLEARRSLPPPHSKQPA